MRKVSYSCITKVRLVDYFSQKFGFSVFISNFPNRSFQLSIFSALIVLFFFSLPSRVWSQEYKPRAVVMGLNMSPTPEFSEQILLHNLRKELARTYDFSDQSSFEQVLQKIRQSTNKQSCLHLKCILKILKIFPQTSLFLLKSIPKETRLTLVLIGENRKWRVKHEACLECRLTQQDMLKSIVLRMESYTVHPTAMLDLKPEQPSKSSSPEYSLKKEESDQKIKTEVTNFAPEPKINESKIIPTRKAMLPLELLKFKIAQRRYNQLIWKNIKKDLMFFRQKHRNRSSSNLKTRLRLQIDQFGKVIEQRLLKTSGSQKFDKIIMDSVDQLKLPPPMELLIRHPPYVVTILIQP